MAHSQNWSIIQGKNSIMYFGNSSGILEFDGVRWRNFELSNKSIGRSLDRDSAGCIYVGGIGDFGYLKPDKNGKIVFLSLTDSLPESERDFKDVWFTHCSGKDVYFITNNKIFILHDGEIKILKRDYYFAPAFNLGNRLFINSWDKGLQQILDDTLVDIPNGDFLVGKAIGFAKLISENKVVVGTMIGDIFIYEFNNDKPLSEISKITELEIGSSNIMDEETIYCGDVSEKGEIAIGTLKSGVFIVNQNGNILRRIDNGLRNNLIWDVFFDKDNNLWMATNNGISKADVESPIVFWNVEAGIKNPVENIISFNDTLFFAGFGGVRYLHDDHVDYVSNLKTECYSLFNFKIPNINSNLLLASTVDFGIVEINALKSKTVLDVDAWDFCQSSTDSSLLYLASDNGFYIAKYKKSKWKLIGFIEGINESIRGVQQDENGNIWLCTFLNGVIKIIPSNDVLKPKEIIRYGKNDGLPSLAEIDVSIFNNDIVFLTASGVFRFNEKTALFEADSVFGIEYCDGSLSITEIVEDKSQHVWIAGTKERRDFINVFVNDDSGKYVKIESNALNILPPMSISKLLVDSHNNVWVGGTEGLYKFNGDINRSSKAYKTLIRSVVYGNDTINFGYIPSGNNLKIKPPFLEDLEINYNNNSVIFHFAAPNYSREETTLYQTWLEGFKGNWSVWSTDTKKEFINLSEGDYSFHVRSKNIFNVVGDEAIYEFSVKPPFYRTFWAFMSYFLILTSLVIFVVYLNGKRLIIANRRLERIVEERTNKISVQKEELQMQSENLQVLNEELRQRNDEIIEQHSKLIESNATKNRFFNIIAHDLRSPFQSLIGLSELLSNDTDEFTMKDIRDFNTAINKSAQSGFALLENLLEWARTQTNHIEFNPKKISVIALIHDCLQINSVQASNKEIELKFNFVKDVFLFADSNMLNTIFRNLISNAIKFTRKNGIVTITVEEKNIEVIIIVEDNGLGIEKLDLEKLFRIDKKFSTIGTANETGTGLGLLLCKEFVEKNQGLIAVESVVGKGSKFILKFPVIKE
jgi:signal transduction histidine kinase